MTELPLGIYYEEARDRYRVRVYKFNRPTHCSYHTTLDAAMLALDKALQAREHVRKPAPRVAQRLTLTNLLNNLLEEE